MNHRRTIKAMTNAQRSGARVQQRRVRCGVYRSRRYIWHSQQSTNCGEAKHLPAAHVSSPPVWIDEFSYDMLTEDRCFWRNRSIRSNAYRGPQYQPNRRGGHGLPSSGEKPLPWTRRTCSSWSKRKTKPLSSAAQCSSVRRINM